MQRRASQRKDFRLRLVKLLLKDLIELTSQRLTDYMLHSLAYYIVCQSIYKVFAILCGDYVIAMALHIERCFGRDQRKPS